MTHALMSVWVAAEPVKSWFDEDLEPLSLLAQVLAVVLAGGVLWAVLKRLGARLSLPHATAAAVVVFLALQGGGALRERWDGLDRLEGGTANLTSEAGRRACIATGIDDDAVNWVASRLPSRARFHVAPAPSLVAGGGTCLRFLLLPRLQVARQRDADYVLIWEPPAEPLTSQLRQQGATIETFEGRYVLARLPR
jgi:hypothetical protein